MADNYRKAMNITVMEDCRKGLLEREQEGLTKAF